MAWLLVATSLSLFVGMQALIQAPYCNGAEPLTLKDEREYVFAMLSHLKDITDTMGADVNYYHLFKKLYGDIYNVESNFQIDWSKVLDLPDKETCKTVVSADQKKTLGSFIPTKESEYKALADRVATATYEFWKIERPARELKGLSKLDKAKKLYANVCKLSGTIPKELTQLKSSVRSIFTSIVQPAYDCIMAV